MLSNFHLQFKANFFRNFFLLFNRFIVIIFFKFFLKRTYGEMALGKCFIKSFSRFNRALHLKTETNKANLPGNRFLLINLVFFVLNECYALLLEHILKFSHHLRLAYFGLVIINFLEVLAPHPLNSKLYMNPIYLPFCFCWLIALFDTVIFLLQQGINECCSFYDLHQSSENFWSVI